MRRWNRQVLHNNTRLEETGVSNSHCGQSTLEWVIGAAIILGTLVVGIMAWNNGLVAKIGQMVQRLSQTS